jgi:hypothetical protein
MYEIHRAEVASRLLIRIMAKQTPVLAGAVRDDDTFDWEVLERAVFSASRGEVQVLDFALQLEGRDFVKQTQHFGSTIGVMFTSVSALYQHLMVLALGYVVEDDDGCVQALREIADTWDGSEA